ncbi:MAG: PIN domain nuclease [Armatimonadetes bacterium]|nr:PIN domain nuclease [Armatimonadota bacterium]
MGYLRLLYLGSVGLISAYLAGQNAEQIITALKFKTNPLSSVALAFSGFILGVGLALVAERICTVAISKFDQVTRGDKITIFVGFLAGILGASPLLVLFQQFSGPAAPVGTFVLLITSSLIAIFALRSMRDVLPWYKDDRLARRSGIKILDTNVIIDGRIYDLDQTGFLEGQLYVSKWVIEELQYIADSADPLRRQRGKRGLDVLRLLQDKNRLEVGTKDNLIGNQREEVDSRLVRLAKVLGADLVTNDMNLNHVANLQDVRVLNINDLALALKPNILPNEFMPLEIIKEGSQYNQGVGFLDDGTMVVVEYGKKHIGETIDVKVTQVIQTERGKMIFAEVPDEHPEEPRPRRTGGR